MPHPNDSDMELVRARTTRRFARMLMRAAPRALMRVVQGIHKCLPYRSSEPAAGKAPAAGALAAGGASVSAPAAGETSSGESS